MNALKAIRGFGGKVAFKLKDKSPEICFVGGVVSLAIGAYFLWNGKAKCEQITEEYEANIEKIEERIRQVQEGVIAPSAYTPEDAKKDKLHYGLKAAVAYARVIGAIALFEVGGTVLCGKAVGKYRKRFLAASGVIAQQAQRISQLEGMIDPEKLKEANPKSPFDELAFEGPFQIWFDERSRNFVSGNPQANKNFLWLAMNYWNNRLDIDDVVFLNQIIRYLDAHTGSDQIIGTQAGQIMGVTKSKNPKHGAVGHIDFGIDWDHTDFSQPVLLTIPCDKTPVLSRCGMAKR